MHVVGRLVGRHSGGDMFAACVCVCVCVLSAAVMTTPHWRRVQCFISNTLVCVCVCVSCDDSGVCVCAAAPSLALVLMAVFWRPCVTVRVCQCLCRHVGRVASWEPGLCCFPCVCMCVCVCVV